MKAIIFSLFTTTLLSACATTLSSHDNFKMKLTQENQGDLYTINQNIFFRRAIDETNIKQIGCQFSLNTQNDKEQLQTLFNTLQPLPDNTSVIDVRLGILIKQADQDIMLTTTTIAPDSVPAKLTITHHNTGKDSHYFVKINTAPLKELLKNYPPHTNINDKKADDCYQINTQ